MEYMDQIFMGSYDPHMDIMPGILSIEILALPVPPPVSIGMNGSGDIQANLKSYSKFLFDLGGNGELKMSPLRARGQEIFQLTDINLLPGESLIIDTDLLSVFIGQLEDVTGVTVDSVFFNLRPGENVLTVSTETTDQDIDVIAIWQSRWL